MSETIDGTTAEVIDLDYDRPLEEDELANLGKELAALELAIEEVEAEKKQIVTDYNDVLKGKRNRVTRLSQQIHSGVEHTTRKAEVRIDADKGVREYLDPKSGEVLRSVPLEKGTHQPTLPTGEPDSDFEVKPALEEPTTCDHCGELAVEQGECHNCGEQADG